MSKKAKAQPASFEPLPCAEVIKAVERKYPRRIPLVFAKWWGEGLHDQYRERLKELDRFPDDVCAISIPKFDAEAMGLSWKMKPATAHDANVLIDDWAKLDEFIAKLPDPARNSCWDALERQAEAAHKADRYVLCGWWGLFFETPWGIRGMENIMVDYYENPEQVHRLHAALCELYCKSVQKAAQVLKPHGFWGSDDLGNQVQPMMRRATFDEFLKPYYAKLAQVLRAHRMHFWLHSCGNNTDLLPSLIDAGVNMFHPVQKHTMDEKAVAQAFGDRLGFWTGFDVQHTLREATPEQVRAEVRFLVDTFDRPEGGMCLAAGNGIVSGTPFENIAAFLDEAVRYGQKHRAGLAQE